MQERQRHREVFFYLCVLLSIYVIWPFALPFVSGIVLAYLSEGLYFKIKLKAKVQGRAWDWVWAVLIILFVCSFFIAPMVAAVYIAALDTVKLLQSDQMASVPDLVQKLQNFIRETSERMNINISLTQIYTKLRDIAATVSNALVSSIGAFLGWAPDALFKIFLLIITWGVFIVHGRTFRERFLPKIIPWTEQRRVIRKTTGDIIQSVIVGNITVSVIQAVVTGCLLAATGVPKAFLGGLLTFFLSFIPIIGTAPVPIIAAIYSFSNDKTGAGIVLLVSLVFIGTLDNLLRPFFMKGDTELDFYWILLAFVGGIAQFGLAGIVIGPLAFALFVAAARAVMTPPDIQ